jgi:hypothetical protein
VAIKQKSEEIASILPSMAGTAAIMADRWLEHAIRLLAAIPVESLLWKHVVEWIVAAPEDQFHHDVLGLLKTLCCQRSTQTPGKLRGRQLAWLWRRDASMPSQCAQSAT